MSEIITSESAIDAVIRHWRPISQLASFAQSRHGFGDSDGGFGIIYAGDQDDFELANEPPIPPGSLRTYGFWGSPDGYEFDVPESIYLQRLARALEQAGFPALAQQMRELQRSVE